MANFSNLQLCNKEEGSGRVLHVQNLLLVLRQAALPRSLQQNLVHLIAVCKLIKHTQHTVLNALAQRYIFMLGPEAPLQESKPFLLELLRPSRTARHRQMQCASPLQVRLEPQYLAECQGC